MHKINSLFQKIQELESEIKDLNKKIELASLCGIPSKRDRMLYKKPEKMINLYD
jgi:hypothetical protein